MSIDRDRYLERQRRYNKSKKGRERNRSHNALRRSDPEYRKWMTLYQLHYRHRRKQEARVEFLQ